MNNTKKKLAVHIAWSLLFIIIIYFPVFHYLNHLPIRWWEESLFGLRALYMFNTGSYLSDFQLYDGLMQHLNTKLPFTTWIQVIFIKIMGVKVLALRLPISLIFLATIAFALRFSKKHLGAISIGAIFALVLVCSPGIVRDHMLRTGDHDLPFICYLFVMVVAYYQYLESTDKKYLTLFVFAIIAALLTKNLLTGAFFPGLLLYTIYAKKLKAILTDKLIWTSIAFVIGVYISIICYLESSYPGFVDRMWNYELMGRYTNARDGHSGGFAYFIDDLANHSFKNFFWLVPLSLITLRSKKLENNKKRLLTYLGIVYFSYLLIISFAKTKLFWYGVPIIPIGALMIGIALQHGYTYYTSRINVYLKFALVTIFVSILFVIPYYSNVKNVINAKISSKEERFGLFMNRISIDHPNITSYTLADKKFGTASMWYKEEYNINKDYQVKYANNIDFEVGETVMTCLSDVGPKIIKKYNVEVIQNWEGCQLLIIKSEK